jgi:hypothetical protein
MAALKRRIARGLPALELLDLAKDDQLTLGAGAFPRLARQRSAISRRLPIRYSRIANAE